MRYLLFFKPYAVLSDFADPEGRPTLADYVLTPGVEPAGRLDADSEGLMLLTDDGRLAHALTDPSFKLPKTYFVQVERAPDAPALQKLRRGVLVKGEMTAPAEVELLPAAPELPPAAGAGARAPHRPHRLAEDRPARGQKAADPPHDRRGGLSHPAHRPRGHRPADPARARSRQLAGANLR